MHWAEANVNPMLALRNAYHNERWGEAWAVMEHGLRQGVRANRQARRQQRKTVVPPGKPTGAGVPEAPVPVRPSDPPPDSPAAPEPKPVHPWRKPWSVRRQRELAGAP
jgi:hypothetical protein